MIVIRHLDDLRLWLSCGALVLGLHFEGALLLTQHHEIAFGDEQSSAVAVDLAAFATPPTESKQDLAPGIEQQQQLAPPAPLEKPEEPKVDENTPVAPPAPSPEVTLPPPETKVQTPPKLEPQPAAPATTAPPRQRSASAAETQSWYRSIAVRLERNKGYPDAARSRGETGIVELAFTIDRQGRVIASRVARSSGHKLLDEEAIATVKRAQNFPAPPDGLPGENFDFTVPIRFNIR